MNIFPSGSVKKKKLKLKLKMRKGTGSVKKKKLKLKLKMRARYVTSPYIHLITLVVWKYFHRHKIIFL